MASCRQASDWDKINCSLTSKWQYATSYWSVPREHSLSYKQPPSTQLELQENTLNEEVSFCQCCKSAWTQHPTEQGSWERSFQKRGNALAIKCSDCNFWGNSKESTQQVWQSFPLPQPTGIQSSSNSLLLTWPFRKNLYRDKRYYLTDEKWRGRVKGT